jgi:hypothetical protein
VLTRVRVAAATTIAVVGLALCLLTVALPGILLYGIFGGVGAYLVARVPSPGSRIGWLLILAGWGLGLGSAVVSFDPAVLGDGTATPGQAITAWTNSSGWAFGFCAFVALALVFPTGRLPQGRVGVVARFLLVATTFLALAIAFGPTLSINVSGQAAAIDVPNPLALVPATGIWSDYPSVATLYPIDFAVFVAAAAILMRRFARSHGVERLQFRWLVAAVTGAVIGNAIWAIATFGFQQDPTGPADLITTFGYSLIPVSIAIAVLRYRLYAIDRIVSRTIAYSVSIAVLGALFALAILSISTLLGSIANGAAIAVAAATLAAYFAAMPVVRASRAIVDRRFDRTRYDAERIAGSFADRMRAETDVDAVSLDLMAAARATVAPTTTSVWIR